MFRQRMRKLHPRRRRFNVALALLVTIWLAGASIGWMRGVMAQDGGPAVKAPLVIKANFTDNQPLAADAILEFQLNRPLANNEGRMALLIGQLDVTGLCAASETALRYEPKLLRLPPGESVLTLYLAPPVGEWREVARFSMRVADATKAIEVAKAIAEPNGGSERKTHTTAQNQAAPAAPSSPPPGASAATETAATSDATAANNTTQPAQSAPAAQAGANASAEKPAQKHFGFDKLGFTPSLVLSIKSQPAQSNFPAASRPARPTFTDMNMQGSIKTEMARGLFISQSQFDFVGSSFQNEALRFGQLGDRAPQIDLASYLMQIQTGKVKYQAGQFSYGTLRHLMNSFSSRGMMITLPVAGHGDFSLAAMNGTSVVGFANFFGLDKRRHQLLSATLGWEFLPKRPGGFRFEAGILDGWLQPINGFSQGSVNDAERSRGTAFRVLASDKAQRFKLESGFTRSQFINPADALLNQNTSVSPLPAVTRDAFYLDASAEILKDKLITKTRKASLTLGFRTERVDPLFRSLGASTQADKFNEEFSASGVVGDLNVQFTHTRFNDNLANIPSILKSLTRANTLTIGVPLASLFSDPQKPSPLWPRVSYTLNRTYQFGAAIPINGGFEFDRSAIPNQLSNNQAFTADWQIQKLRLGYRLNQTLQDNRQPGFEQADLAGLVNGFAFGFAASSTLDLGLDINDEAADNRGARQIDRTLRLAPTINWRMTKKMALASNFSTTLAADEARTRRNRSTEFDMQWTYQFGFERDRFRKMQGQFFIRYANRYAFTRNFLILQRDLQRTQIVNMGLSLNFF